ncbi:unnamed protein product [Adineta steineri]|uniref:GEVED domain-containing protein n=1 Tax=Adineta steineri TaxID=433720 RepID=A0A813N1R4_9BILA|nr:unnamed protein product [Adineta steineri]CAF4004976.1 unnamed protein product [Adineta steineri]
MKTMLSTSYYLGSEDQSKTIKNIDDLMNKININLAPHNISIFDAFFLGDWTSERYRNTICENPLMGNILQLHILATMSDQCASENKTCTLKFQEQFKNNLTQLFNIPFTAQFADHRSTNLNMKLCSLTQMPVGVKSSSLIEDSSICFLNPARIILITMDGEQDTKIRDKTPTNITTNDYKSRQNNAITLYENSVNKLTIQLDCSQRTDHILIDDGCSLTYNIDVWIDLNDDGKFDESENRIYHRSLKPSQGRRGAYDLEMSIPQVNGKNIKTGQHRMLLSLLPSEDYRKICNKTDYDEMRQYTANIVSKATCEVASIPASNIINNISCSSNPGKIMSILINGEHGTYIRDRISSTNTVINNNDNQDKLGVTWFSDAIYLLRLYLDCSQRDNTDCNIAHHVNVWIDLNDDGKFDEFENRVHHRSSINNETSQIIYDLQIFIPMIDKINTKVGPHRMLISVIRSEVHQRKCGSTDYSDTKEYTLNVIPRKICADMTRHKYCLPGNLMCSADNSAIFSVKLFGEQSTMIDDEMTRCSPTNNYEDQSHLVVKLFENKVYALHIQLYCVVSWNNINSNVHDSSLIAKKCHSIHYVDAWIDLNNDGKFDDDQERFVHYDHVDSSVTKHSYDVNIAIPQIHQINNAVEPYRMRVILTSDQSNRKPCYNTGYGEARDYTVYILRAPY